MSKFVHLHLHSEYSLVDGLIRIEEMAEYAARLGMRAIAITDYCNLFAMIKFYQAAEKQGIKPIIGADVCLENQENPKAPYRLILLCQNEQGYRHLTELVSQSYIEGQSLGRPLIKKEWLRKLNAGLIAIANSHLSDIAQAIHQGAMPVAESLIIDWMTLFPDLN